MKLPFGLQICKKVFERNPYRKKVVSAYIEGGTIIIASNSWKTHPESKRRGYLNDACHAEFNVLKSIDDASSGELFVYRTKRDGSLALSKPCVKCAQLLKDKNVRKVTYTTDMGFVREKIYYE